MAGHAASNLPGWYVAQLAERLLREAAPAKPIIGIYTDSGAEYRHMELIAIRGPVEHDDEYGGLMLLLRGERNGVSLTLDIGYESVRYIELPSGSPP